MSQEQTSKTTKPGHPHTNLPEILITLLTLQFIWTQPIVPYQMPNQMDAYITSFSHSILNLSTAIQYTLIGVYDKLSNPLNKDTTNSIYIY